jgi:hypothetical protein
MKSLCRPFSTYRLQTFLWLTLAWLGCLVFSLHAAEKSGAFRAAMDSITGAELKGYVGQLADEKMEGREAGSRGGKAAADYLAEQFAKLKLRSAADGEKFKQPFPPNYCNILGMIPGGDPELKDEFVIVGAHYDHVGRGARGISLGPYGTIHPGADDNASGTSALLELAKAFGFLPDPPKRSILIAAWDAEEKGLYGSKHWIAHPTVRLEKVVAYFNLDMIGHLRDDRVEVYGSRSGSGWRRFISRQNEELGLKLDFSWKMKPIADHYPFFQAGIPVLLFHTGTHDNYHRPSDTADLIDGEGMSRVVRLLFGAVYELAESDEKIPYRQAAGRETPENEKFITQQVILPAERLGVAMDAVPAPEGGVKLVRVSASSPAGKAGLKPGDRILRCAGRDVRTDEDLIGVVMTAESPVELTLHHKGNEKPSDITVELAGKPLRLGITWRVDDAEPGAIILTHVVPCSPAARAGLQPGDRVYQISGRDFTDENAFLEMVKALPDTSELLVDRDGRLRTVIIQLKPTEQLNRAA